MIFQSFDLRLSDPLYKMRTVQAITIKPGGMFIKATLRDNMTPADLDGRLKGHAEGTLAVTKTEKPPPAMTSSYGPSL